MGLTPPHLPRPPRPLRRRCAPAPRQGSRVELRTRQIPPSRLGEDQASHLFLMWGFFVLRRPACVPAHAAAGLARALLTSAPATRLAERAPVGYITPTICPL